ncbi:twitch domain-containing radical SAM protein [Halobacteriovorax sp.]|uniref:twitch domain-containing radical SAM protein n=1 Tax=Halobacteriovorax sp. TaxID=2020862 RepID=UPI0035632D30
MTSPNITKICSAPWVSLAINADKSFSLCCNTLLDINVGSWDEFSILEVFQSADLSHYRSQFLKGSYEKACKGCYADEESNLQSKRDEYIKSYRFEPSQQAFAYSDIKRLELFLSNKCNFNCRTCGSFFSTSWNKDNLALSRDTFIHKPPTQKQMKELLEISKSLDSIYIAGGEPLICQELYLLLESFVKFNNECNITINTNLSTLQFQRFDLLSYIEELPNLNLNISLDGLYEKGEYIRNGLNFNRLETYLDQLSTTKVKVSFIITVSILNILDIDKIILYIVKSQPIQNFSIEINFVQDPSFYNIQILPDPVKSLIIASLYSSIIEFNLSPKLKYHSYKLLSICTFLKVSNNLSNLSSFYHEVSKIDQLRKQSFETTFPELSATLNSYKRKKPE